MDLAVIVNPNALYVRRRPDLPGRLRALVGARGEVIETRTPEDVRRAAESFAARDVRLVATCGGDGTNLSTITAVIRAFGARPLPSFAILRGGTVNTIAENLGIAGTPEEILARLLERLGHGAPTTVGQDLLQVNGNFGFLFAAAMGARFLEAYYGGPVQGPAWAGVLATRTVASSLMTGPFARWLFSPVPLALTVDDQPVTRVQAPRLLLASTVPDVGIGMKVTWQAGRQPGRFHLLASNLPTVKMAMQLPRVLGGRPLSGGTDRAPHLDVLARSARIRFAQPETYTLDGDLFREREIDLRIGPRIWVARP
jgi:diacylglycerol kinase family enzyme